MGKIKLAAMDIDGTLLNSKSVLPEAVRQAVCGVCASEAELVISTGRSMCEMGPIFSACPEIRYHILGNGASIYDAREDAVIYRDDIAPDTARKVFAHARNMPVMFEIFADGKIYTQRDRWENAASYHAQFLMDMVPFTRTTVESMEEFLRERREPVDKINLFFHDFADCERILALCAELALTPVMSTQNGLEFNNRGTCKGKALQALCKRLCIAAEEVLAMGDGESDISMLDFAGVAVVPANAEEKIKAHASLLAPGCDEEGAAWALKNCILEDTGGA